MSLALFCLGGLTWLIGGNLLVILHHRRLGQSVWAWLRPFSFPFATFNMTERLMLIALMVVSLGLIALGCNIDPAAPRSLTALFHRG